ncbi:MAG TPA: type II secretion system F family protein [Ornithinimicrobium sp.]|uniref:type II secretion system F family protein n=1 Tax=Ornithinimicrobium sp. TaxID=1977084 RepID=UPI002B4A89B9|nr:type II secretion system F family protein [Ornithinimicrobium sp.]HKJ12371.1 type II secretion system F family protein [Ornithinimicrobium sp.]
MSARAGPEPTVAEVMDHLALALSGAGGVAPALREVADVTPGRTGRELATVAAGLASGQDEEAAWSQAPVRWEPVQQAITLAGLAGAAPAELLRAAAADLRRDALAQVEQETARMSVWLVLPLGLAFLPAFVLTTVVPLVVSLATSISAGW